jgi:protein-S-isoprenylcysteine O-methyltransferase Ste14
MERPLYVGLSGLALGAVLWLWQPFGPVLLETGVRWPFHVVFAASLILIVWTTKVMDHPALFGLKQGRAASAGASFPEPPLNKSGLFRHIRHPLTSLLIIAIWSHPTLTASQLLLNLLITAYSLLGIVFEERDLVKKFGKEYEDYRAETPAFIPSPRTFSRNAGR